MPHPQRLFAGRRLLGRFVEVSIRVAASALLLAVSVEFGFASVLISINKSTQQMSVSVDGTLRHRFTISTGKAGYGTPNGSYRPQRLARSWFSRKYYNSPMPHSIFFYRGYAIHGSYEIDRLGGPASHGCVRLHPNNASTLYALVRREGMSATRIVVHGSSPSPVHRRPPAARPEFEAETDREFRQPVFPFPFFGR